MGLSTTTGGEHTYTSTACYHKLHDRCRLKCKFCDAPCRCYCHAPPGTFQGDHSEHNQLTAKTHYYGDDCPGGHYNE